MDNLAKLFDTKSGFISYNKEMKLIYARWKGIMESDEMKYGAAKILNLVKEKNALFLLVNQSEIRGSWQETNLWLLKHWFPKIAKSTLHKTAFIYSADSFGKMTLCLLLEKVKNVEIKAFETEEDCLEWFSLPSSGLHRKLRAQMNGENRFLINSLQRLLTEDKVYLELDISLSKVSEILSCHPKCLSQIINMHFNKNFNQLINEYRLKEATQLLKGNISEKYTFSGIGLEAGFPSKSSFYRSFKLAFGLSPKKYKEKYCQTAC